ncbi:unnamed protein product [Miscanthus lutarioriparius]|uniref:AAA+ ATPase domain-containing protein n=1 Tax=Miscanthus lutarioriparius TaxID=422564 RepID=A0A811QJN3_9POAL|nr:unnamed protein product [Miscanthus lutarioriparius]
MLLVIRGAIDHYDEPLHEPNAQAKGWVNRARELAYDGEDWADLLLHRVQVSGGGCTALGSRIHNRLGLVYRDIASELRKLRKRAVELIEQFKPLSLNSLEPVDPRLTTPFVDVCSLVGLDGPMEKVTKMVTGAGGKMVVSIVGMAGSGKTTLAMAVYQQLIRQKNRFHLHAFVSLGQEARFEQALNSMLSELGDGHREGPIQGIEQLISRIREILENKRYLIVVDDLWSSKDWEMINYCFPNNSLGSRIITTTRNLALAEECCPGWSDCIYNTGLLSEVDSRKLILDRAFGIGHGCPPQLEDVLAQIIRRCSGLPLALVTVASMLEGKFSKDKWHRLIGSRWSSDAEVMKQIFNRSYSDLPHHLRACLLDLSIFPDDFKVDVDRLMRRWMADGYIDIPGVSKRMEEIARRNINELISRNMVQRLPPIHGAPRYCRLHPVIHDFVVCKSMEDNFVTLVDDQSPPISTNDCTVYWRLSVQSSKHDRDLTSNDGMDLSHVRSITVFGQASAATGLTNLRVVRVLDLEGCVGPVGLDNLDKLPLLRYLNLKGTDVTELPATIWELRFLESLDVRSTKVKQLPPSIMGLRHLRTLLFGHEGMINSVETATRIAGDIQHCGRLQNLATIDLRVHPASFVKALGDLNALRVLEIIWSFHQCTEGAYCEVLLSSMEKWSKLRSLTIHCGLGCWMEFLGYLSHPPEQLEEFKVTAGGFVSVPKWIQRLSHLSFLQITICKTGTDNMKILRDIPQLQSLILGLDFVPREPLVIGSEGFSKLLRFSVDCPVPWLTFQTGAMPKLTHLQLEFCSGSTNPDSVPSGVGNLQRLTEVVLLYNQKWCADSSSVIMTIHAVKRQVGKHHNLIDLIINDTKVDVQEVDVEMKHTTEIQSGDARTTVETQGEIEIVADCDNIGSTY